MLSKTRKKRLVRVISTVLFVLFATGSVNAGHIADIDFTETKITIYPNEALLQISMKISGPAGDIIFQRQEISEIDTIDVSEFASIEDGLYRIIFLADSGQTIENVGRVENGRENKTYVLKKWIEQTSEFSLFGGKILNTGIIEE